MAAGAMTTETNHTYFYLNTFVNNEFIVFLCWLCGIYVQNVWTLVHGVECTLFTGLFKACLKLEAAEG